MRQGLYSTHIGGWRRYSELLAPLATALQKHLPDLERHGALPFPDKMNWALDPEFDYEGAGGSVGADRGGEGGRGVANGNKKADKKKAGSKAVEEVEDEYEDDYYEDDDEYYEVSRG